MIVEGPLTGDHALQLHRRVWFDAVHHLTWGGIRAPTFMGALKIGVVGASGSLGTEAS
jgi:hypothetical protein